MNHFWLFIVSAFSVGLPVCAGFVRLKRVQKRYFPFAVLLWAGLVNETISYWQIKHQGSNMLNSNSYTLIEFLLLLWFFYRLNARPLVSYYTLAITGLLLWVTDNLLLHSLWHDNTFFRLLSFSCIIYLGMDRVNEMIFQVVKEPCQKTDLLLCTGFFIYYTYQVFVLIFNMFPMGITQTFYIYLWLILSVLNILINIVYTIALLWIPKRQEYTLRS